MQPGSVAHHAATPARPVRQCRLPVQATEPTESAPGPSTVKIRRERKPGEPRGQGRHPVVGYVEGRDFVTKFGRQIKEDPLSCFKLPVCFERCMGDKIPSSVYLGDHNNGRVRARITKYERRWYIDDGWRQFAEAHSAEFGDIVVITCTGDDAWAVEIIGINGELKKPDFY